MCLCTCSISKAAQGWHAQSEVISYSLCQNKIIKAAGFSTAAILRPYPLFATTNTASLPPSCVEFRWRSSNGQGGITAYIYILVHTHTRTLSLRIYLPSHAWGLHAWMRVFQLHFFPSCCIFHLLLVWCQHSTAGEWVFGHTQTLLWSTSQDSVVAEPALSWKRGWYLRRC